MKKLVTLVTGIQQHHALNNDFYDLWIKETLTAHQLAIFARNYWEWTYRFPEALATLITITQDLDARVEYVKTLYSEMGYGNPSQVHASLFNNFYSALCQKLSNHPPTSLEHLRSHYPLLNETQTLITWERNAYGDNQATACGAQLAIEWQAYTMLRKLYNGACNYQDLWVDEDHFHEHCEFFYVHIGSAEKEHKQESIYAAEKLLSQGASFEDLSSGFNQHLILIANFWCAIAQAIKKEKR